MSRVWRKALGRQAESAQVQTSLDARGSLNQQREQLEYDRLLRDFQSRTASVDIPQFDSFYWYHTIDLGDGLVTPGDYDFRGCVSAFGFPDDMTGLRVLDVGPATGFFSFECERRGAEVVTVELPSLANWDILPSERDSLLQTIMRGHGAATIEELDHCHLKGPIEFCHTRLQSSVERCFASIYDLSPAVVGNREFDWVILGDLLIHLLAPVKALAAVAPLCRGTLIVTADAIPAPEDMPLSYFFGNLSKATDCRSWSGFNRKCIEEMLHRVGFDSVSVVGRYSGFVRRAWMPFDRYVFHARKG